MSEEIQIETLQDATPVSEPEAPAAVAEEEELVVNFGDEPAPEAEEEPEEKPTLISDLRKMLREKDKMAKQLKQELEALKAPAPVDDLGAEPTLADFDYDEAKFKSEWRAWDKRKEQADAKAAEEVKAREAEDLSWKERVAAFTEAEKAIVSKAPDYQEAKDLVAEKLPVPMQALIVAAFDDPVAVIYGLGKHPAKLAELSSIKDPAKFAVKLGELKATMKVGTRKPAVKPDERVSTGGGAPLSSNAALDDAREVYRKNPTAENFAKIQALKKK